VSVLDVDRLRYVILPGRPGRGFAHLDLWDRVYDFWEALWDETFRTGALPDPHWRDAFLRQDRIVALLHGDEIAAVHLYSFLPLQSRAIRKNSYFEIFPPEAFEHFAATGYAVGMTMEYLGVGRGFRKDGGSLSLADVLLGLGCHLARELGIDCCLGTPIKATKLDESGKAFGGYVVVDGIERYGYPINFMVVATSRLQPHPDPMVDRAIAELWETRRDLTTGAIVAEKER
jgi:hypothetical protein